MMGELLPGEQAMRVRDVLLDYLTTTFALAGSDTRDALARLLEHQWVVEGLTALGIEAQAVETTGVLPGKVAVLTMHRAKGTEFACVLLFGLSNRSIPMGLDEYQYDEDEHEAALQRERSLVYVAASRARDELVITYHGAPSPLLPGETR